MIFLDCTTFVEHVHGRELVWLQLRKQALPSASHAIFRLRVAYNRGNMNANLVPNLSPLRVVSNTYHAVYTMFHLRWKMAHSHRLENGANLFDRATLFPGPVLRQRLAVCERGRENIKVEFKPSWRGGAGHGHGGCWRRAT